MNIMSSIAMHLRRVSTCGMLLALLLAVASPPCTGRALQQELGEPMTPASYDPASSGMMAATAAPAPEVGVMMEPSPLEESVLIPPEAAPTKPPGRRLAQDPGGGGIGSTLGSVLTPALDVLMPAAAAPAAETPMMPAGPGVRRSLLQAAGIGDSAMLGTYETMAMEALPPMPEVVGV